MRKPSTPTVFDELSRVVPSELDLTSQGFGIIYPAAHTSAHSKFTATPQKPPCDAQNILVDGHLAAYHNRSRFL